MTYRQIHIDIWDDPWFLELDAEGKLLFIYLFSNKRTNAIGLYEISQRAIAFESGLPLETIRQLLEKFAACGKIRTADNWIWVPKLLTRNTNNIRSPQVQTMIAKMVIEVPDACPLKGEWVEYYNSTIAPQYGIDMVLVPRNTISGAEDTFCSATASDSVSVSDSVSDSVSASGECALEAFVQARGGAVNPIDVDQIADLVDEFEKHRLGLPRASPGADMPGDSWVRAAILEGNASRKDGRMVHLNYIKAILDRWRIDGFQAKFRQDGTITQENGRTVITVDS